MLDIDKIITPSAIMRAVSYVWKIPIETILEDNQTKKVCEPRHICMYMMSKYLDSSLEEIGQILTTQGGHKFDHTLVIHAKNKVESIREYDSSYNDKCAFVERFLKGETNLEDYMGHSEKKKELAKLVKIVAKSKKLIDKFLDDPDERFVKDVEVVKREMMDIVYHISKRIAAIRQKLWKRHSTGTTDKL